MRYIVMGLMTPLALGMLVMLAIWGWYIRQNAVITHNVNVSSEFSIDFKENIDLKMYHFMVGSKLQKELPIEDVETAIILAQTLQETAVRKESRQAIKNVLAYCENLEEKMYLIAETKDYEGRKQPLEKNIYILTSLIQESMMSYLYYEVGYLAQIEQQMFRNTLLIIVGLSFIFILLIALALQRAFRFVEDITQSISKLCNHVSQVGQGQFNITSVMLNRNKKIKLLLLEILFSKR